MLQVEPDHIDKAANVRRELTEVPVAEINLRLRLQRLVLLVQLVPHPFLTLLVGRDEIVDGHVDSCTSAC